MPSQPPPLLCRYGHDPLDRLISQTLLNTPARHRFYCKSRLVTEIQGAMHCSIVQHGDQLLAQQQNEAGAIDTSLLATDLQRSVLQTLKGNHPRQSIAYLPYGHRPFASGILSLLGFNGERTDPVTGHYLLGNGYRAFNPVLMRFNSPDSLSPFGKGGLNAYAYCAGNPINTADPTGHSPTTLQTISNALIFKLSGTKGLKPTLKALERTYIKAGGEASIIAEAAKRSLTPNAYLVERTVTSRLEKIDKHFKHFANFKENLTSTDQISTLTTLTRDKISKHVNIMTNIKNHSNTSISKSLDKDVSSKLMLTDRFGSTESSRIGQERMRTFHQKKIVRPPDEQLDYLDVIFTDHRFRSAYFSEVRK